MGKVDDGIDDGPAAFVQAQPVWFVATAPLAADGHVHVSPRGHDCLSVLGPHRVAWVDDTGSGIETAAHLRENGRICPMSMSYGPRPRIGRLHGRGSVALPGTPARGRSWWWTSSGSATRAGTACRSEVVAERDLLRLSADKRGPDGLRAYRAGHSTSVDGLPGLPVSS